MKKYSFSLLTIVCLFLSSNVFSQTFFKLDDYKKAEWMTARFYGAQRGTLKTGTTPNWLLQNHGNAMDFNNDNDAGYDLTGGWFDCGDHPIFGQTQFYSAYILLKCYDLWPKGYGDYYSQNYDGYFKAQNYNWEGKGHDPDGIPDIVNEVKFETDFLIKATRSATQFYSQKGQGNADHKHWITSVKMATLNTANGGQDRVMYSNVKDASMASFCGATLALMSRIYRKYDTAYANTCLKHALYAYAFAKANPGVAGSPEGAFYGANQRWQDDYASMCTELFYATDDIKYKTEALSYEGNVLNHNYCFGYNNNDDIAAYNLATLGSARGAALLNAFATTYVGAVDGNGIYTGGDTKWGTLRYNANAAMVVAMNLVFTKKKGVPDFIYKQVDYILGNNKAGANNTGLSFVVGFGANAVKYPHHRNVYLSDADVGNNVLIDIPARNAQFGYLIGGIRTGTYTGDQRDNYVNSEGGIDYSAGLVGAIAYILSQIDTVAPTGFAITSKPLAVSFNGKSTVTTSFTPAGATSAITWTSANANIASVDANGIVTGVTLGSAYIYAKTSSGKFKDSTLCTVSKVDVIGITINPTLSIAIGNSGQLVATTIPANASDQTITYVSSDESIATVSATGKITPVAIGTVTITATTAEGSFKATSSVTITGNNAIVIAKKTVLAITVDGDLNETVWNLDKTITKAVIGTQNNTETFGVLWDNTNLYIGIKVIDATITTNNNNLFDNDAVEIYFDLNNNGGGYDASDRAWMKKVSSNDIWERVGIPAGAINANSTVKSATKIIPGGYSIELAIPWTNLGGTPNPSVLKGFDVVVDDADAGTTRTNQSVWIGTMDNWQSLANIGDLQLSMQEVGSLLVTQTISLTKGWNLISFNVVPTDSSISSVFNTVLSSMTEIKNGEAFYSTENSFAIFNSLTDIEQGKAYLVKMKSDATLSITGIPTKFTATKQLNAMKTGWNLVGCIYQAATPIATAFDITKISIVKNFNGFYVPIGAINSLNTVIPNGGYFVKKN